MLGGFSGPAVLGRLLSRWCVVEWMVSHGGGGRLSSIKRACRISATPTLLFREPQLAAANDGGSAQAPMATPTALNSSRPTGGPGRAYRVWAVCGFLLLLVGLVFGQTLGHEFIGFDDRVYVYENPHVTAGLTLPGLWWALTDGPFGEWYPL